MVTIEQPPVRYSVSQPGYDQAIGERLRICVDGVEQKQVVEYDCEAGTVLKNKLGADGHPMLNDKRDQIEREIARGDVTVVWRA